MTSTTNFTERTEQFWNWFTANEEKLSQFAQNRDQGDSGQAAIEFISEGVSLLSENLHFNIGGDHEFTFAVNANDALFFLLPYVTANLPEPFRDKWTFHPCMQGTGGQNFGFAMYETQVDTDRVMVSATPAEGGQTADLLFYAKEWESLEENNCYNAFYILMELSIGEALANACIEEVKKADSPTDDMFPLTQLEQWLLDTLCENGEAPDPANRYFAYSGKPDTENPQLRQDVFAGSTNYMTIINGYYGGKDNCYQTFAGFGAKPLFLYYYYDGEADRKTILNERYDLTDKLEAEVLGERGTGQEIGLMLGGAMGEYCAYIDLLLYDEQAFMEKARELLADSPYMIFCKEFYPDGQEFLLTDLSVPGFKKRLQQLHEVGAHREIIKIFEALPVEQKDFDLTNLYARALNNVDEEEKALQVLDSIREPGELDALWNWRYGYALYYLEREAESIPYLQKAIELGDESEETAQLLQMALEQQENEEDNEIAS